MTFELGPALLFCPADRPERFEGALRKADAVILDGETLALDENDAPRPFQETMSRFGAETARDTVLHPWFFDILHVDGRDLLDVPLRERREEVGRIAPAHRIPGEVTDDPEVAERVAAEALAAAAGSVFGLLARTEAAQSREILLVEAQDEFVSPSRTFPVEEV